MPTTATAPHDPRTEFLFLGAAPAIDLVNTEVVVRGRPRDLLATPAALATWLRELVAYHPDAAVVEGPTGAMPPDAALLAAAKRLRAALRAVMTAIVAGRAVAAADMAVVNDILRTADRAVAPDAGGTFRAIYRGRPGEPDAALFPVAASALDLLTTKDLTRLRHCDNERCVLFFYDTTKSATRRWCSVGCMNRARSIARYRARKQAAGRGRGQEAPTGRS